MTHYFTDNDSLRSDRKEFTYHFDNETFTFTTDVGVFSKSEVDFGSYLLIKNVYRKPLGELCLDLGSGYGPIGIIVKRFNPSLTMDAVDVNSRAIELTKLNAKINNVEIQTYKTDDILTLNKSYDTILLNPPIRTGKIIIYGLYEKAHAALKKEGSLYIVIRKKQGADTSYQKLKDIFKEVNIVAKEKGYVVIQAIK